MGVTWADSLNAIAAAGGTTTAIAALWAVRRANRISEHSQATAEAAHSTAEAVARIERERWHHDLTPEFEITIGRREGDRAALDVQLRGPITLGRLDEIRLRITSSDDRNRVSGLAGARTREEVEAQVWGPYRFTHGADGADSNGHTVSPVSLQVGRGRPFAIERTRPPSWWEGGDRNDRWRNEWVGKPLRLVLECRREGFDPWLIPYDIEIPAPPRVRWA